MLTSFLPKVGYVSKSNGLFYVQKPFLSLILKQNYEEVYDDDQGAGMIKKFFYNKKVLLILDDVS